MVRVDRRRWLRRWLAPLLLAVAPAITSGCLDFDEEEVHVAYDAEHDRLDAQLVYRGLYSASMAPHRWLRYSAQPEDCVGTEKQLDQLLSGRPIFALFYAESMSDLVELRESEDPQVAALAKLVAVDRGELFKSEDGRICAWQHLRVRNVTHALELWDDTWRTSLADASHAKESRTNLGCDDPESIKLWSEAIAKPQRWLERCGAELLFHVPASGKAARTLAARIEAAPTIESLVEAAARKEAAYADDDDATDTAVVHPAEADTSGVRRRADLNLSNANWFFASLHTLGITVRPRAGGADLVLWDATRGTQTIAVKRPSSMDKHYDLAPYLEKRKVTLRTDVDEEVLQQSFAAFRSR
jgi:hypothetical protein